MINNVGFDVRVRRVSCKLCQFYHPLDTGVLSMKLFFLSVNTRKLFYFEEHKEADVVTFNMYAVNTYLVYKK